MKVFISPMFRGIDKGDGGIRRVVEAQNRYLPDFGWDIAESSDDADVIAVHAGNWTDTDKPVVAHCHGLYWREYLWPHWALDLNRRVIETLNKADYCTAPSKWVAEAIKHGMWIDPTVVYHGINPEEWSVTRDEGYVLWNKTRVDAICDPTPLNELVKRSPEHQFISTFGTKSPNVKITGRLPFDEAKSLIEGASVYLCTTRETFGIGTIEAMVCGIPILGWAWGGQQEFILHKETGWLSKPGDIDHLVEGLQYCFEHRHRMGSAARQYVLDNFTWPKVIQQYADIYQRAYDTKPKKTVSVVIPCYNMESLLPKTVESVTSQTYKDIEIIIVDDASTDSSGKVADALAQADPRIRVIHNESNQYLAEALNSGIDSSSGKFILPLDADNEIAPRAIEILVQEIKTNDIAYGAMEVREPNRTFISTWPPAFNFSHQIDHHNQITSTALYRKKFWQRVGGYRRRCRTAEDADFWCRMTAFGARAAKVTDGVILIYNNRHDSMSHTVKDWPWDAWYTWCKSEDFAPYTAPVQRKSGVLSYDPPVISVIIPVGVGHERLVLDALDSLAAQTFTKWEAVVINDTGVPLKWIHPFAKVITTKGMTGAGAARNIGLKNARGALFLPLDADDYLQPDALKLLYEAWLEHRGYIYTDYLIQETNEIKRTPEYNCEEVLRMMPYPITALFPYQCWLDVGGFDETLKAWEDWDFLIAINTKGYCGIRLPEPLVYYRLSTGSRREYAQENKASLREVMLNKWRPYVTKEVTPMACGCKKGTRINPRSAAVNKSNPSGGTVLIEFVKSGSGIVTYRGKSGTNYRFGSDVGHRFKYVLAEDVEWFLARREFRRADGVGGEILEAVGPPNR